MHTVIMGNPKESEALLGADFLPPVRRVSPAPIEACAIPNKLRRRSISLARVRARARVRALPEQSTRPVRQRNDLRHDFDEKWEG